MERLTLDLAGHGYRSESQVVTLSEALNVVGFLSAYVLLLDSAILGVRKEPNAFSLCSAPGARLVAWYVLFWVIYSLAVLLISQKSMCMLCDLR